MQTSTSLTFFTAIFVALGGALAEELMICCRHVRTELYIYIDYRVWRSGYLKVKHGFINVRLDERELHHATNFVCSFRTTHRV